MKNDLISRQEAIDEIDEWIKAFRENVHKESAADARFIRDGIIQLPSVQPVAKDINVPVSDCTVRRQILVVESPFIMKPEEAQDVRNRIIDQMKSGLVILPQGYRAITCDKDMVNIKGELENE